MARKRSRIDGMKMPFVVTMSVAASACGGSFTDSHRDDVENGGDGGGGSGGADQDTGGARNDTGGVNHSTGGHYDAGGAGGWSNGGDGGWSPGGAGGWSTGGAPETGGYIAAGGAIAGGGYWNVGGSINPPYPYGCPVEAPVAGTPCYGSSPPPGCSYPGNAPCQSTRVLSCVNGAWSETAVYIPTCNPPPPSACPAIEPAQGQSCINVYGTPYSGPDCGYGDCYGSPTRFWRCVTTYTDAAFGVYWTQSAAATCNPPPPGVGGASPAYDAGAAIPPNP